MSTKRQTSSITSTTLQQKIGTVLRRVAVDGEHITVERDGYPIAVIVPIGDYKTLAQKQDKQQPR